MHPTIGRTLHYRLPEPPGSTSERWRPATVVNDFGPDVPHVNLTVLLDGINDLRHPEDVAALHNAGCAIEGVLLCVGSAVEGTAPGCWRWPPRV
jgi:hypothetical protein